MYSSPTNPKPRRLSARVLFWGGTLAVLTTGLVALGLTPPNPSVDGPGVAHAAELATPEATPADVETAEPVAAPVATEAAAPEAEAPSATPEPVAADPAPVAAVPDHTYAPCEWFADGHDIPADTDTAECYSAAEGKRVAVASVAYSLPWAEAMAAATGLPRCEHDDWTDGPTCVGIGFVKLDDPRLAAYILTADGHAYYAAAE